LDSGVTTRVVFKSLIVLGKKHYDAALRDDQDHSRGVSYVRHSGSMLRSHTMCTFVRTALLIDDKNNILRELSYHCHGYVRVIHRGVMPTMFHICTTCDGVTGNYIRVINKHTGGYEYISPDSIVNSAYAIDIKYYEDIVHTSLTSITNALGIPNCDAIYTGQLMHHL